MKTFCLAAALLLVSFVAPPAAADPHVCTEAAAPDCEGALCVAARTLGDDSPVRDVIVVDDESPACVGIVWADCTVEAGALCVDPSDRECPVQRVGGDEARCVGDGETELGFGACHASVTANGTTLCVDPDGPCFVALVEGDLRTCVAGLPA